MFLREAHEVLPGIKRDCLELRLARKRQTRCSALLRMCVTGRASLERGVEPGSTPPRSRGQPYLSQQQG
ncbi:unnamed protein product [Arctogadus glacialis]